MKAKLKRCPFCNGHDLALFTNISVFSIQCIECHSAGPVANTQREAVKYWNEGYFNPDALVALETQSTRLVTPRIASNRADLKEIDLE